MNHPPLNLYAHKVDPAGVLAVMRRFGRVSADGPDDGWQVATLKLKKSWASSWTIEVRTSPDHYNNGPEWSQHLSGMQGYFHKIQPDPELMSLIGRFRFSIAVLEGTEALQAGDKRMEVMAALAQHLDAVVFAPGHLFDSQFRLIVHPDGGRDANAVMPTYPVPEGREEELEDEEPEDGEVEPPSADRVARRAMVLAALAARSLTENEDGADPDVRASIWRWVEEVGAAEECEPDERQQLTNMEAIPSQLRMNSIWRVEGLAVLLWALGLHELETYDTLVQPPVFWELLGLPGDPAIAKAIIANATLRDVAELKRYNTQILSVNWRMVEWRVRRQPADFVGFCERSPSGFSVEGLDIVDRDLALGGTRIDLADEGLISAVSSLALERHLASNWLDGWARVYSETDTST